MPEGSFPLAPTDDLPPTGFDKTASRGIFSRPFPSPVDARKFTRLYFLLPRVPPSSEREVKPESFCMLVEGEQAATGGWVDFFLPSFPFSGGRTMAQHFLRPGPRTPLFPPPPKFTRGPYPTSYLADDLCPPSRLSGSVEEIVFPPLLERPGLLLSNCAGAFYVDRYTKKKLPNLIYMDSFDRCASLLY